MQWRMPVGPVYDLTGWIEAAGCVVIEEDFDTARVDGLSQWVGDHPVVLMNISSPTDRKRLTLAHELGHLCLHSVDVTPDMEAEANAFAAEFLMPAEVIRSQLRNLSIGRLIDLKREWGVSMQAIIERAYSLKVMTATQRTSLYKRFSSLGWRTREPGSEELPQEHARWPGTSVMCCRRKG
jgi:Zn-dependent peptidase ImmA (M78 family)